VPAFTLARTRTRVSASASPGASNTFTLKSNQPVELGWLAIQATPCTGNCVETKDNANGQSFATNMGGRKLFAPAHGIISITHRNTSKQPVKIKIYRIKRTCNAESCAFLKPQRELRTLVIKVGVFKAITTSKDGSYSVVSGDTTTGKPFSAKLLWWTDDPKSPVIINCAPTIQTLLDKHAPPEDYSPYILPGTLAGGEKDLVLTSISGCAKKATHYGVDEAHVY
jgi:hypothetical protein